MNSLVIKDLYASIEDKEILKGINLTINAGEVHALLGPNGHGKSTLLNIIMGHPKYKINSGTIVFDGIDITNMEVNERAKLGIFLAMQYPPEISGVTVSDFMKSALQSKSEQHLSLYKFIKSLEDSAKHVGFSLDMVHRFINEGFSGGEKKRCEILQMQLLNPGFTMMDEIDSGLDVDAINLVSNVINESKNPDKSFLIVSHYARLYSLVKPTHVHVVIDGKIVVSGDASIIDKIDKEGFEWIEKEYGVSVSKQETKKAVLLESCARKVTK